jgi:hypothetical protein
MTFRHRIGNLMIVIALVASFVGFFAPELRSWDRDTLLFFSGIGIITAVALASFSPVWMVLLRLRRRSRQGMAIRAVDYAIVAVAYLSSLAILVALGFAIRWMVVR